MIDRKKNWSYAQ